MCVAASTFTATHIDQGLDYKGGRKKTGWPGRVCTVPQRRGREEVKVNIKEKEVKEGKLKRGRGLP